MSDTQRRFKEVNIILSHIYEGDGHPQTWTELHDKITAIWNDHAALQQQADEMEKIARKFVALSGIVNGWDIRDAEKKLANYETFKANNK